MSFRRTVKVIIPTGFGINCEAETAHAFMTVGAQPVQVHLSDLIADGKLLAQARILVCAGGFSFGDHLGGGKVFANRLSRCLGSALTAFISDGGLVMGICNGFQTLVHLGLVPNGRLGDQTVGLAPNRHGHFYYNGWVALTVDPRSPCIFTKGLSSLFIPARHGEGRLIASAETLNAIRQNHLAPLKYADPESGKPSETFPANPNGSMDQIAGLCDISGRIFGIMPHPEAFLYPENHPLWRQRAAHHRPEGLAIFENAVTFSRGE